jgi:sigma-B regulation protein RsbU (phosphoserine phosphatase)
LAIVIADVSGKGIPAALFMVTSMTLMRNCTNFKSPKGVLEEVNNKLCENNEANMFVTALMGFYNIPSGRFVYVNAGHTPPLVRKGGQNFEFIKTKPCIVLGFMESAEYQEEEITLQPGDSIYLYTDGVTEALNSKREFFTEERLLETIRKDRDCTPKELILAIKEDINNFAGGAEQADDITMLALGVDHYSLPSDLIKLPMKELIIEANKHKTNEVIDFINAELDLRKCSGELQKAIDVAAEEIFVNIASYAYAPEKGNVTVGIIIGEEVMIRFEDTGKPYNPLDRTSPDLNKPIMERETGGLGIFLVKRLMDKVYYSRLKEKNILVITKK